MKRHKKLFGLDFKNKSSIKHNIDVNKYCKDMCRFLNRPAILHHFNLFRVVVSPHTYYSEGRHRADIFFRFHRMVDDRRLEYTRCVTYGFLTHYRIRMTEEDFMFEMLKVAEENLTRGCP